MAMDDNSAIARIQISSQCLDISHDSNRATRYCRHTTRQLQAHMISFRWWVAALIFMSMYWPITVMATAAIVMASFLGTKSAEWRAVWSALAILIVAPVIWFYTLTQEKPAEAGVFGLIQSSDCFHKGEISPATSGDINVYRPDGANVLESF
ncbi:hypothetical protein [Ochrobactrum sp. AP1BH01-1]|jgi:hypothetical protein|uniref:hypothetical protein n=1 Tax=Ochrobactrum sp. AP1BH01-1 TaxID=2823874 RepID=UPI001B35A6A4|nr:hypothetical protein [Ochrobactrum sp. AP1BH01-1]MBQ0707876.1 hypothetical protein [Ochrobactrum sp. AP1BH01-1]